MFHYFLPWCRKYSCPVAVLHSGKSIIWKSLNIVGDILFNKKNYIKTKPVSSRQMCPYICLFITESKYQKITTLIYPPVTWKSEIFSWRSTCTSTHPHPDSHPNAHSSWWSHNNTSFKKTANEAQIGVTKL